MNIPGELVEDTHEPMGYAPVRPDDRFLVAGQILKLRLKHRIELHIMAGG
jgi:hypothetical protein